MSFPASILFKARRQLNYLCRDLRWKVGPDESGFTGARGSRILVYHGVCRDDHLRFNTLFVNLVVFEQQLRLYKRYFNVVSLDDFYLQRFSNDRFTVCLTFDDGFANNYKYVLPLLEQYEIPAAFFVTGVREEGYDILWNDFLSIVTHYGPRNLEYKNELYCRNSSGRYISATGGKALADLLRSTGFSAKKELMENLSFLAGFRQNANDEDYWQQMTEGQLKALASSRQATIGCHGYYHNDLAKIQPNKASEEIIKSKKYLEAVTGKEIKSFAFPYGSYTQEVKEETKKAGFKQLLATEFHFPEDKNDPAMRERLTVNPYISAINQVHAGIKGHYD